MNNRLKRANRQRARRRGQIAALLGWLMLAGAGAACAEDALEPEMATDPGRVSVLDRPRPEWDAVGFNLGRFQLFPDLKVGAAYDDNILATDTGALADVVFTYEPQLRVTTDWLNNSLSLAADTTFTQYADHSEQDSNQYAVTAGASRNTLGGSVLDLDISYARTLLSRASDSYSKQSLTPLLFDQATARIEGSKTFDRVKIQASGQYQNLAYLDGRSPGGAVLTYQFRDADVYRGQIRGDYIVDPDTSVFIEESYGYSVHDRQNYRFHNTNETLVGLDFLPTHLIRAELAAGYLENAFSRPDSHYVGEPDGRVRITYYATRLITVALDADESVVDSGVPTSPDYLSKSVDIEADYELLRNVIIVGKATADWNDYRAINRHDFATHAKISATYFTNREVGFMFAYERLSRSSSGSDAGKGFDDNLVSLSLVLQR